MIDTNLQEATATAPATVSNVAVGFDILGFSLTGFGDRVTVRRRDEPGVTIVAIRGDCEVPEKPEQNSATAGLVQLLEDRRPGFGLEVEIQKRVPVHAGLGGSASSAVAAVVAASAVIERPLTLPERFHYALLGEKRACGKRRGDNIAPAMLGGLVLVRSMDPLDVMRIPVPHDIESVVVYPHLKLQVRRARQLLDETVQMDEFIAQSANLAGFIGACFRDDRKLIGRSMRDLIVEPQRSHLVPGFDQVKAAASDFGALGCSLAGSGPAMFALYDVHTDGEALGEAMVQGFERAGVHEVTSLVSPVNGLGAHVVERGPTVNPSSPAEAP